VPPSVPSQADGALDQLSTAGGGAAPRAARPASIVQRRLNDVTAHGEFTHRCAEAFSGQMQVTDLQMANARDRASKYMRLAQNRTAWLPHNPQSLNEAAPRARGRELA
jgi:hypothetical protein